MVVRPFGGVTCLSKGVIAPHGVHPTVHRHYMHDVGIHGRITVEPTFGKGVLLVIAGTLGARTGIVNGIVGFVRIHVPDFSVAAQIGLVVVVV